MALHERTSAGSDQDQLFALISAVADGDASRDDVVAALKDQGIDSLDVLVAVLVEIKRNAKSRTPRFLDPQRLASSGRQRPASAVHRSPGVPFVLNGVMYDPDDITRFNDRDLHMIARGPGEPLVAIDDHALMVNWWQLSYLMPAPAGKPPAKTLKAGTGNFVSTVGETGGSVGTGTAAATGSSRRGSTQTPAGSEEGVHPAHEGSFPVVDVPYTNFWEHPGYEGDRLDLGEGKVLDDLTDEHTGIFGWGDSWNDRISSVQLVGTTRAVLWDDVGQQGESFTCEGTSMPSLPGFNDRASAVWTQ